MTNVSTPAPWSCAIDCAVLVSSRQPMGPAGPIGSQQLGGMLGMHVARPSMFAVQLETPHMSAALQFGPPSVARIANVVPVKPSSSGASASKVSAVGVPPAAMND